jgi:hypothetical protein
MKKCHVNVLRAGHARSEISELLAASSTHGAYREELRVIFEQLIDELGIFSYNTSQRGIGLYIYESNNAQYTTDPRR